MNLETIITFLFRLLVSFKDTNTTYCHKCGENLLALFLYPLRSILLFVRNNNKKIVLLALMLASPSCDEMCILITLLLTVWPHDVTHTFSWMVAKSITKTRTHKGEAKGCFFPSMIYSLCLWENHPCLSLVQPPSYDPPPRKVTHWFLQCFPLLSCRVAATLSNVPILVCHNLTDNLPF